MPAPTARLEHAFRRAEASGDGEAWIEAAVNLHLAGGAVPGVPTGPAALLDALLPAIDRWRGALRSRAGRLWAGQLSEELLAPLMIEALGTDPPAERAMAWFEALRARTLLDELCVAYVEPYAAVAPQAAAHEAALLSLPHDATEDRLGLEMRLLSELPLAGRGRGIAPREHVEALERLFAPDSAGFAGMQPFATLAEIQDALRPGEALAAYFIPFHPSHAVIALWVAVVTPSAAELHRCAIDGLPGQDFVARVELDGKPPIDVSPLGQLIWNARQAIQATDDARADANLRALDDVLLGPIRDGGVEAERLVVVPHRLLHAVPWSALSGPDGRPLAERAAVGVAPSASILAALRRRPALPPQRFLGIADPATDGEPLTEARAEVAEIAAAMHDTGLTAEVLEGEEATEAAFRNRVAGANIVHLAVHAGFPMQDALDMHTLLLAPGAGHDGEMRAGEVRAIDLSAAWVTVLSVCDGGLSRFGPGDEPYGLVRALLVAGSRNVVATLWQVDDDMARALTVALSRRLIADGPVAALRAAEMPMIGPWPTGVWAAFTVIGACL